MIFNQHSAFVGHHAFLGASKHSWSNYDMDKLEYAYIAAMAAARGTELHKLAHDLIRLKQKLPNSKKTLNMYVNDGIGYRMKSEQVLYVSRNCFGTPDTIAFEDRKQLLRIHDLKTGVSPASVRQLEIYAAMFCIEYAVKPFDIEMELRIYQNDAVDIWQGDPDVIVHLMEKIRVFDNRIELIRMEAEE